MTAPNFPHRRYAMQTPHVRIVGRKRPFVWIGSVERGVLLVLDEPKQVRAWIRSLRSVESALVPKKKQRTKR